MNTNETKDETKGLLLQCVGFGLMFVGVVIMIASFIHGHGTRVSVIDVMSKEISPMTELVGGLGMLVGLLGAFLVMMGSSREPGDQR